MYIVVTLENLFKNPVKEINTVLTFKSNPQTLNLGIDLKNIKFIVFSGSGNDGDTVRIPPLFIHSTMFDKLIVSTLSSNGAIDRFELNGATYIFSSTGILKYSRTPYDTSRNNADCFSKVTILFFN